MTPWGMAARRTATIALQQVALSALLFLLLAGWLHIPDANALEVLASVVLALLVVGVAGAGESWIALRLTERGVNTRGLLRGMGIVFTAALIWFLISVGIDHVAAKNELYAGYLNSRSRASARSVFTYEHIGLWLGWMENGFRWIAAELLAAAAFASITSETPLRGLRGILLAWRYWLALLLLTLVGAVITGRLLFWTPGHGLRVEMLSFALRILSAIALNAVSVTLLLQAMAGAVLRYQSVGTGAPVTSQPRTVENP